MRLSYILQVNMNSRLGINEFRHYLHRFPSWRRYERTSGFERYSRKSPTFGHPKSHFRSYCVVTWKPIRHAGSCFHDQTISFIIGKKWYVNGHSAKLHWCLKQKNPPCIIKHVILTHHYVLYLKASKQPHPIESLTICILRTALWRLFLVFN